jgi:hypothetical protein
VVVILGVTGALEAVEPHRGLDNGRGSSSIVLEAVGDGELATVVGGRDGFETRGMTRW